MSLLMWCFVMGSWYKDNIQGCVSTLSLMPLTRFELFAREASVHIITTISFLVRQQNSKSDSEQRAYAARAVNVDAGGEGAWTSAEDTTFCGAGGKLLPSIKFRAIVLAHTFCREQRECIRLTLRLLHRYVD